MAVSIQVQSNDISPFSFLVPPTIRPDPSDGNYIVKKGRRVELKCLATGNPEPTITWSRLVRIFMRPIQSEALKCLG